MRTVERGHAQELALSMPQRKRTKSAIAPGVPIQEPHIVGFLYWYPLGLSARQRFSKGKYRSRVFGGMRPRAGVRTEHAEM